MFKKILIANRGEIACRIIQSAHKMGIQTVAVYSEADKRARHVELADEAVYIGPAPSRESYLQASKIIAACKASGAEAVHPGYGFLSENQDFARQVELEGLIFIGPKHESIAAMGDKIASKKLALKARVNTIPGYNRAITDAQEAVAIAQGIGYPVMIKASAGGGGKGLRVAFNDQEALDGFSACRNEALSSFGDDRIFIEKYVEEPRHIEIQVLGDAYGNMVYLGERECSIQRRHQKVIEEAPSPFINAATRKAMGAQAVSLAKAVQYQSAGTVEFVVGKDQSFYFLEMNTRLQVEHPVTELITGIDLVEWMIRIAAGETLTIQQAQVQTSGWAIECRINAENPYRGFLPSTGRLVHFQPPEQQLFAAQTEPEKRGVRVDTGVQEGGDISMHYDSMLAKLIVHGSDRVDAIARMREALNAFVVRGISSNIPFQSALLAHSDFAHGQFNTGFIAENYPQGFQQQGLTHAAPEFLLALAVFLRRKARALSTAISGQVPGYEAENTTELTGVLLAADGVHTYFPIRVNYFDTANSSAEIEVKSATGTHCFAVQSSSKSGDILMQGICNGKVFNAQVERTGDSKPLAIRVHYNGVQVDVLVLLPRAAEMLRLMPHKPPPDMSKYLLAPMPGLLSQIAVTQGQTVRTGEQLATIEAMKMENTLLASQDGVVKKVAASAGVSLMVDEVIIEFE